MSKKNYDGYRSYSYLTPGEVPLARGHEPDLP